VPDNSEVESAEDEDDVGFITEQTESARYTASLGITIIHKGKTAWPKVEYGDDALPGENAAEHMKRVNDIALNGVFDLANQGRSLMQQIETNKEN